MPLTQTPATPQRTRVSRVKIMAVLGEGAGEFAHPRLAPIRARLDAAGGSDAAEEVRAQEAEVRRLRVALQQRQAHIERNRGAA